MIPRSDVDCEIHVDARPLSHATVDDVVSGIACIHGYEPGVFAGATWAGAEETLRSEREELGRIDAVAEDEAAFEDAAFEAQGELCLSLEFGVTGAVEVLCAAGCPTFASCRGHSEGFGGRSFHPWVLFAADAVRLPLLVKAAQRTGCGLDVDEAGLLTLVAPSVVEAVDFGLALLTMQRDFDALPQTLDRDAAIPEEDEEEEEEEW